MHRPSGNLLPNSPKFFKLSRVKYESCDGIFDSAKQITTMKEDQNSTFFYSKSFGRETDSLTFEGKESNGLNDSGMDAIPTDESSNCKFKDDFSMDNGNGTLDSPTEKGQNAHSLHLNGWDKDTDSLSSDSNDTDKEQRRPEHENATTVEEFANCSGSDSRDLGSRCNGTSNFETDTNLFADKNVVECLLPELEVCYKDIDYQTLKDICVDEGTPEKDINVIDSCQDEKPSHLFLQPLSDFDYSETTERLSLEYSNELSYSQCGSKKENDGKKLAPQGMLEYSLDNPFEKDTTKHCDPEELVQTDAANCGATGKAETNSSEEDSLVDRKLPVKDFGAENKVLEPSDQILNGKVVSESHATTSAEAGGTGKAVQASSLLYNSKVESGSITFNFDSSVTVGNDITQDVEEHSTESREVQTDVNAENLSDSLEVQCTSSSLEDAMVGNGITKNVEEHSADSGDVHKGVNAENLSDSVEVQCTSSSIENVGNVITENVEEQTADSGDVHRHLNTENLSDSVEVQCTNSNIENVQEQSIVIKDGNSDGGSSTSCIQCVRSEDSSGENANEQSPERKVTNSDDLSADDPVQSPGNESRSSTSDAQAVEPNVPKHEQRNNGNISAASQLQHDAGETSFSAASLISYSGQIAFSGSLSHRSDGSTTSGKSFAFPILQSEWNSSPVRMAKADRRHFRKHKGWRTGLLCCRF